MNFAHSLMTRLNEAASRVGAGVREMTAPHPVSAGYEKLRDALMPVFDQFVDNLAKSGRAVQSAAVPYIDQIADSARSGVELVHDKSSAGAQALADMVQRRRGLARRHPYLIVIAIAGTGYIAVQQWRKHAAATRRPSRSASRPSARAGSKSAPSRRSASSRAANARTQRERRARGTNAADTTAADKIH